MGLQRCFVIVLSLAAIVNAGYLSKAVWMKTPGNITEVIGGQVTLECRLNNTHDLKARWSRNGTYLTDNDGNIYPEYEIRDGVGQYDLVIKNLSKTDNGFFTCSHVLAEPQHQHAFVNVLIPFESLKLTSHGLNVYSCKATHGKPAATLIRWKIDDRLVASMMPGSLKEDDGCFSTNSVYEINDAVIRSKGTINLTCEVTQLLGVEGQSKSIRVTANHGEIIRPKTKGIVTMVFLVLMVGRLLPA
ncbi:kin of IRRE-like protein 1 isoform X2 [Ptychodera flava]|uniref:kin of IRRE-like protein 1 isoform X2 n=1 Tax=Ptychodera flava TaxID=63121 RepID=UPI00396A1D0D